MEANNEPKTNLSATHWISVSLRVGGMRQKRAVYESSSGRDVVGWYSACARKADRDGASRYPYGSRHANDNIHSHAKSFCKWHIPHGSGRWQHDLCRSQGGNSNDRSVRLDGFPCWRAGIL